MFTPPQVLIFVKTWAPFFFNPPNLASELVILALLLLCDRQNDLGGFLNIT